MCVCACIYTYNIYTYKSIESVAGCLCVCPSPPVSPRAKVHIPIEVRTPQGEEGEKIPECAAPYLSIYPPIHLSIYLVSRSPCAPC